MLHWLEVSFEIITCCTLNDSPSSNHSCSYFLILCIFLFLFLLEKLPALVLNKNVYSGYREISRGLEEVGLISKEISEISTLINREFLLQMNQDLLIEEFNNEDIFKNFTEPALLNSKSRYFWNFVKSRIFPLNYQLSSSDTSKLFQLSVKLIN